MKFEERLKMIEDARKNAIRYYEYKGNAYQIHNDRSLLEDVLGPKERFNNKLIQTNDDFERNIQRLIDDARKLKDEYAKLIKTVPYETVEPKYLAEHRKILSDLDKDQP